MNDLIFGLGLVLALEGMLYAGAPVFMKRMLESMRDMPTKELEKYGWLALALGLLLIWFVRG